ncbi:putative transposase IS4 (plasmid) [Rickettsia australis str. Cutlack]|uniref:Putative transposase IS4 n=1 Tax=Rickettsia australis (strain Cutlack) TaxID=1105110 RepID=H8K9Y4_RICAC|nr:putative transposase IS4 [Rickettsia australis str. Cutlack]
MHFIKNSVMELGRIEAQISRIKRCIGSSLLTKKISSQKHEAIIISNIINLWNSFGKCVAVKIG